MSRPDPAREIRLLALHTIRGANYWATRPVTRLELAVGAYDDLSSAHVPGFTDALLRALPGLVEHRCSVGERGGFVARLRGGTYAPHIVEHVALELQSMIGHEVGYGRARGRGRAGEYTVVFEHRHAGVGRRAATLALDMVQRAFNGSLESARPAVAELESVARMPDPLLTLRVLCGITGGGPRAETQAELIRRGVPESDVVDVAPTHILRAGLPYASSEIGIILDADPRGVPDRYREPDRARRLVSVVADAVREGGLVLTPAGDLDLWERIRDSGRSVAVFTTDDRIASQEARVAHATACVRAGRIELDIRERAICGGTLAAGVPARAQVAAALATYLLRNGSRYREMHPGSGAETAKGQDPRTGRSHLRPDSTCYHGDSRTESERTRVTAPESRRRARGDDSRQRAAGEPPAD